MEEIITNFLTSAPIIVPVLALLVSLYTVGKGADILVDNAVSLSLQWGIPKMVLGATLVSLGTTVPEASVSVVAAIQGNPDLSLGNAIGSIIVDTGLIIGIAALLGNLPIDKMLVKRQGRLQFVFALLLALVCLPIFSSTGTGKIYQWIGFIFVFLLCCYMYFSFKWAKESTLESSNQQDEPDNKKNVALQLFLMFLGIAIVVISSKILIPSVAIVATKVGIPKSIIAATIVAFGTSVPELVTAITSVRKGVGELAVGNVVGADILNVLFVLGLSAAVTPQGITVPFYFYYLQIPSMLIILVVFRFCSTRKSGVIGKMGGAILFSSYIVYLILNFLMRQMH
ncbi:MAG: calcium/sodium antiporter [Treponema sp.]